MSSIITIAGSISIQTEIMKLAKDLTIAGDIVFTPLFINASEKELTNDVKNTLNNRFYKLISISHKLLIITKNYHIGESVQNEIKYANDNNIDIEFYNI